MKLHRILLAALLTTLLRPDTSMSANAMPPTADLSVSLGSLPAQLQENEPLTVSITVSNLGPHSATSVRFGFDLDTHTALQSISALKLPDLTNDVTVTVQGGNVTCSVPELAPLKSFEIRATISAILDEVENFELNLRPEASAAETDPNPANNFAVAVALWLANLDFGDARSSYPVTRAENGARHRNGAVFRLGANFDSEANGIHKAKADGDDLTGVPDDEDGVLIPTPLIAGHTHEILVAVPVAGHLDAFFDFNNDGDWNDPGERVTPPAGGAPIGPGLVPFSVTVPIGAVPGTPHVRFRFSEVGGLGPTGFHFFGEVEDYPLEIQREDFGNAPGVQYPTLLANDGARHVYDPTFRLGAAIDYEGDGLDGAPLADEDGVVFLTQLIPGAKASVQVTASVAGMLDAFLDFNFDGDWVDAGERITLVGGTPLAAGANVIDFDVPQCAASGYNGWARFRFSNVGGLDSTGPAPIGEVEDYQLHIESLDYGDAPSPYPTLYADDGAREVLAGGWSIGSMSVDLECDGQPSLDADGDDTSSLIDDEDGVTFSAICPGSASSEVTIAVNVPAGVDGYLNVWLDWNRDGDWADGDEHIVVDETVATGTYTYSFPVSAAASVGQSYARVRLSSVPGASYVGLGEGGGEVEDYKVPIGCDWGDAPDNYQTLSISDGPRHGIRMDSVAGTWMLGAAIDLEADGQPVNLDDVLGTTPDDEDGVVFLSLSTLTGGSIQVTVNPDGFLDAWIDFDQDGVFMDAPPEKIFASQAVVTGVNNLTFAIPPGAVTTKGTWARFRFSSVGGLTPSGPASDGEVEDYGPGVVIITDDNDNPGNNPGGNPVNLAVTLTPALSTFTEGESIPLTVTVSNLGSNNATGVQLSFTDLTGPATAPTATSDRGTVTMQGSNVVCSVATIVAHESFSLQVTIDSRSYSAIFDEIEDFEVNLRAQVISAETDFDPTNNFAAAVVLVLPRRDFGDAPDSSVDPAFNYSTRLVDNGARHRMIGPYFGPAGLGARDPEPDGTPTVNADGDDVLDGNDDEAGITFLDPLVAGTVVRVQIDAPLGGRLDAWMDCNLDGQWTMGAPEQIFTAFALLPGVNTYTFTVPAVALGGQTYFRFRLSTAGGLSFTGYCSDGEVDDYIVTVDGKGGADDNPEIHLPLLHVAPVPGGMELTWDDPSAVLEQALSLTGPWRTVAGAVSPYIVVIGSEPMKLYRLRLPTHP